MKTRILIIDNYDSFTFNLAQIILQNDRCECDIIKNDAVNLERAAKYDKILFSPGPGIPSDTPIMKDILAEYQESKSILGVCLGHQAIAEFYGMKIINLKQAYHGIKMNVRIIQKEDYLFDDMPDEISAGLYHSWAVDKNNLPDELKILAVGGNGIVMALSHLKYDVKGIQFHPESYMTKRGTQIINNWLNH